MKITRIAVVGLGQIGGSIVLALRRKRLPLLITGIDPSAKRRRLLRSSLDDLFSSWSDAIEADLVVLCMHYESIVEFLKCTRRHRTIMDVCSGKAKLVQLANRRKLRFIGGHPMTGNEFSGEKGWRENLFDSAPFFLCPGKYSSPADRKTARRFVKQLGARPVIVDPQEHDRFVAVTSHFPAVLSIILNKMGADVPSDFHGPGFQSMTRLANTSPLLLRTFLKANGENIERVAEQMRQKLRHRARIEDPLLHRRRGRER